MRDGEMRFAEITAEIDASALRHNLAALRACCRPGTRVCVPLKANAYGHGLTVVAPVLDRAGADSAVVATLDEAIALRGVGWTKPILVLGAVLSNSDAADRRERLDAVLRHDLAVSLVDAALLPELSAAALAAGRTLELHLKLDTGMGRMGLPSNDGLAALRRARDLPGLRIGGIYSHFGTADLSDHALVDQQLADYREFLGQAGDWLPAGVVRHLANTAATITRPDAHFDMVRPGIGLFGLLPAEGFADKIDLRPAMRVVSRISATKTLPVGHCVGYGCTFRTARPTRLGIVPAGYHDGFLRGLSNLAVVGTAHGDAPVVGRISMDQFAVDLTDLQGVKVGETVTLIDPRRDRPNSVASIARLLNTISYEVVCVLGQRIQRVISDCGNTPRAHERPA